MSPKLFLRVLILILIVSFSLSACSLPFTQIFQIPEHKPSSPVSENKQNKETSISRILSQKLAQQAKINKFANIEELKEFLEENQSVPSTKIGTWGMRNDKAALEEVVSGDGYAGVSKLAAPVPTENQTVSERSDDYSRTNVQVEGVDEADIVKTDGQYIYVLVRNDLYIVRAYPAKKGEVLAKIKFKSRPYDIYVSGDRLVVFGNDNAFVKTDIYRRFHRRGNFTFFKVFDISDRVNPKQIRDFDFEGSYYDSRLIGDYVYFVTTNYDYYYIPEEPILPRILEEGKVLSNKCSGNTKCFMPDIYYFNIPYSGYNFTTVTAINIKDASRAPKGDVYLMSSGHNMYVSPDNIYLTYTKYISEYELEREVLTEMIYPRLPAPDQRKIKKIKAVERYILTEREKAGKINRFIERYINSLPDEEQKKIYSQLKEAIKKKYQDVSRELEKTVIHKIAIADDKVEYRATGEVPGYVLNQFSMDERNGYFRIATTRSRISALDINKEKSRSYANLYILDKDLKIVGAVEKLAPNERIYSVRFMQNRAYLVTFRRTDPLFVIDLSNSAKPKVLGKLKIPGFSEYLHPYNNNLLIGLGKETMESEWGGVRTKGLKLSLFDVSDVTHPREVDTYIMGDDGSDSIALRDHKAFLFSREKNLLVIPVSIRESVGDRGWGKLTFSGAAVFKVDKNGFSLRGKIDHSDGGWTSGEDYWNGVNYYNNTVKRVLYIDSLLYTFSNKYLKINQLEDLSAIKTIPLYKTNSGNDDDFEIIK
jgi:uncharacterized secreted protein with C-terminal beta-propeller domain